MTKISVLIPTLNVEVILRRCLMSVMSQNYPGSCVEVIVLDGGSKDGTVEAASWFGAVVVHNPERTAESAKRIGVAASTGDIVLFLDSDNELVNPNTFMCAEQALRDYPDVIGIESLYVAGGGMNSFCVYLTKLLHISDPMSWFMAVTPALLRRKDGLEWWTYPSNESLGYPLGANGFFYLRSSLVEAGAELDFEDTRIPLILTSKGKWNWLRITDCGIRHWVALNPWVFMLKRRRQAFHFLSWHARDSWSKHGVRHGHLAAFLYCASVILPTIHAAVNAVWFNDRRWLWHPVACVASVVGTVWGVLTFVLAGTPESELQPKNE